MEKHFTVKEHDKFALLYNSLIGAMCLSLSVGGKFLTPVIVLYGLTVLVGTLMKKLIFRFPNRILLLFIGLYVLYGFGLLFSENLTIGFKYMEYKLAFLLFPILFSFEPQFKLKIKWAYLGLLLGIFLTSLWGLVIGTLCYIDFPDFVFCYSSGKITPDHPTYYSVMICFVLIAIWYEHPLSFYIRNNALRWLLAFYLFALIIINFSIAAILFMLIVLSIVIFYQVQKRWGTLALFGALMIAPLTLILGSGLVPKLKYEVANTWEAFDAYLSDPDQFVRANDEAQSGDNVRLIMWTASYQELLEHPFGVGTGDVDVHLSKRLKSFGQFHLAQLDEKNQIKYNPHNQFLQTGLEIGVLGLLIFSAIIFFSTYDGMKEKLFLLVILGALLFFNSLFESMLQRQSGIIFFTFWICLLAMQSYSGSIKKMEHKNKISN